MQIVQAQRGLAHGQEEADRVLRGLPQGLELWALLCRRQALQ